ncbi:MAG TPA: succinate dehydrogenase cytochrome b subunit [Gemmatimonadaceae bacterium]|jgi:succinate dehydrogenase / fumarate reductase cytochrome b subunit|nr:succinate dehydrogenase cytochrome b subunit [Gemmatimonadaceae bacterium]
MTAPTATTASASTARKSARRMNAVARFWHSSIGKHAVMAVTGIIMIAFLISHFLANLQVFLGPLAINEYAAALRRLGPLLWLARAGLVAALVLHVVAAYQLTRRKQTARPVDYTDRDAQVSTFAARTIRWGGVALLVFIVLHLLHFTFGTIHPAFDAKDVYGNVVAGFDIWWVALLYVAAMIALGLHLYHGTWSSIRTLGLTRASGNPLKRRVAAVLTWAIYLGFSIVPIAVLAGLVR